jgi:hypothetical protein
VVIRGPRPRTSVSIRGVRDTWDGMEGPICELVFASDPKKSKKLKYQFRGRLEPRPLQPNLDFLHKIDHGKRF